MCRIGAIKSRHYFPASLALTLMLPQQEGHDNSGFAMVMQDLGGPLTSYKDKPLLSLACTQKGLQLVDDYMETSGYVPLFEWRPPVHHRPDLDVQALPYYVYKIYDYPKYCRQAEWSTKEEALLDARLAIRALLTRHDQGYVYSFWPDVLTLKEIGDPRDIAVYFGLWDDGEAWQARNVVVQCRQNTNYEIVRYAAHPFFLQGYTLCANGENTFYTKNKELQRTLHRGYVGFESDSQNFLYTLHYVLHELHWPLPYYKHVITPLPFEEIAHRADRRELLAIRQSLAHLEINGPNTIIAMLPDGSLLTCCDGKKLRPVVVGGDGETVAITSEVCGLNAIMPQRDESQDVYPHEREIVVVTPGLEVQRWPQ